MPLLSGLVWLAAVGWGFHRALVYQSEPGAPAVAASRWPSAAPFAADPSLPTLVLALHPHCPCSRATLSELERLSARCRDRMRVQVLVYADAALGPDWEKSDLWERACALPATRVHSDPGGALAALFGARTSGQVFLFAPDGRLLFEGGITLTRGHEGDNPGADAVAELVSGLELGLELGVDTRVHHTPVFGCALVPAEEGASRP